MCGRAVGRIGSEYNILRNTELPSLLWRLTKNSNERAEVCIAGWLNKDEPEHTLKTGAIGEEEDLEHIQMPGIHNERWGLTNTWGLVDERRGTTDRDVEGPPVCTGVVSAVLMPRGGTPIHLQGLKIQGWGDDGHSSEPGADSRNESRSSLLYGLCFLLPQLLPLSVDVCSGESQAL